MHFDKIPESIISIREEFKNSWLLINETTLYLKRAGLFSEYERLLQTWRRKLNKKNISKTYFKKIKKEIVEFRKQLRAEGHDLRLGNLDIIFKGFKSDDSVKYGFKRAVLYFGRKNLYYKTGTANHLDLGAELELDIANSEQLDHVRMHYVWFRWNKKVLEIAGADSEPKEHFDLLISTVNEHKMTVLKKIKNIQ